MFQINHFCAEIAFAAAVHIYFCFAQSTQQSIQAEGLKFDLTYTRSETEREEDREISMLFIHARKLTCD